MTSELQADGLLQGDSFAKLIAQLRDGTVSPSNRADDHDLADRIERLAAVFPPQEAPAPVRAVGQLQDSRCKRCGCVFIGDELCNECRAIDAGRKHLSSDTRRVASGEVTDAMIEAGLLAFFGPGGDVPGEDWSDMRAAIAAALSASPTRAQAASAGEPVAYMHRVDDGERQWVEHCGSARNGAFPVYAAPTDGRSPNDGGYREVTLEDAFNIKGVAAGVPCLHSEAEDMLTALRTYGAVIRCPAGEKS